MDGSGPFITIIGLMRDVDAGHRERVDPDSPPGDGSLDWALDCSPGELYNPALDRLPKRTETQNAATGFDAHSVRSD